MKRRKRNRLATALTAVVLTLGIMQTVYADGPAGPASDQEAILLSSQAGTGPANETAAGDAMQGTAEGMTEALQGTAEGVTESAVQGTALEAAQGNPQNAAAQMQAAPEGLIASGGRFLDPAKPMVALTFDDGPYAPVGNRLMDVLELYNGRATFFVVGNRIPAYQDEILRMKNNGHEVANHTHEHRYLTGLSAEQVQVQIEQCNQMIAAVTGQAPTLVRVPGGFYNDAVLANIRQPVIMWSIDTRDWKTKDAVKTVNQVLSRVQDGDIILMHELYQATGDAVEAVVPALAEQGYQMVTVSELASLRGGAAPGAVYHNFRPNAVQ